jgi:hypothetical protein
MKKFVLAVAIAISVSSPAYAMKSFLTKQWFSNGNQMCAYDNGTVLNMGARICPLSIEG